MKFLKLIAVLLLIVIVAGGGYLYFNYANLAKNQVEKIASQALNVKVSIASFKLSLSEKSVTVSGVRIANPKGYKKANAVQIGSVSVALAEIPKDLDLIKFKSIDVSDTVVNLEVNAKTTNLIDLKSGMRNGSSPSNTVQPKVTLQTFNINQSKLNPTVTLIGGDLSMVKVPPVTLRGIGTKENGVLAKDAIKQILTQYLNIVTKEANSAGYLKGVAGVDINDLKTQAKDKIESKVKDTLGNIFGN